jgi:hypothetical protein
MSYNPANPNGSATSANSAPVVIASDQAALPLPTGASTSANQTNGTQQAKITNGTNIADTIAGDSGQNTLAVAGSRKEVSFTTTTVQAVASTDVSNYRWVSVHITSQGGSSTVTFQASNDNTNWVNVALQSIATAAGAPFTAATTSGLIAVGPVNARYFRLNVTGIASGTTAGVVEFFSSPAALQSIGGTVVANLAAITTGGYSSAAISTATTTTVKSGAGTLHTISILGGTAGAIDVYDNTAGSGTKLVPTFTPGSVTTPATLTFDVAFATGLTIVTGAATLLQVSYK